MLNILNKTKPLILAAILAATSGFAQNNNKPQPKKNCFDQGLEMPKNQTIAAHSYPARQEVRGSWDVHVDGSYLYWQARQENMDLGFISNSITPSTGPVIATVKHPEFNYKSGFKVGLGLNLDYDNWDVYSEYTWFHGTTKTSISEADPFVSGTTNVIFPSQGAHYAVLGDTSYFSAHQSWDLKMDFADLSLARSYYSGTRLTMRPYFGARGAWIRQTETDTYTGTGAVTELSISNKTISQGVGPRVGLNSNWLLGYGLRLIGKGGADILYTRYNYRFNQDSGAVKGPTEISQKHNDFLRAHADLELGFGWGSYFDNNNWYIDLSAAYGFQVFWDQNMVRNFNGDTAFGYNTVPNGNLYIHGLTATLKFDF